MQPMAFAIEPEFDFILNFTAVYVADPVASIEQENIRHLGFSRMVGAWNFTYGPRR